MVNTESIGNKGVEVIEALCEKFGIVIDWTSENVVPHLQDLMGRIVKYEIATSIFWVIFMSFMFFISLKSFDHFGEKAEKEEFLEDATVITSIIFGIVSIIIFIVWVFAIPYQIYDIIEALTIPEKTVIDLISMIGG